MLLVVILWSYAPHIESRMHLRTFPDMTILGHYWRFFVLVMSQATYRKVFFHICHGIRYIYSFKFYVVHFLLTNVFNLSKATLRHLR